MKYAIYTKEGYEYGTPYGVYDSIEKAIEVKEWLENLGNIVIAKTMGA